MTSFGKFLPRSIVDLQTELNTLDLALPIKEQVSVLGSSVHCSSQTLSNRFVALPMEGFDAEADGSPSQWTKRRYTRLAAGGASLLWFEATAVVHEGRSNPRQLWLREKNVAHFRALTQAVRQAADSPTTLILQLTHSGRYSRPTGSAQPAIAERNGQLDPPLGISNDDVIVSDEDLDRLQDAYLATARLAATAGFDGVDIKCCHGYLLSELLSARKRSGRYGGSFDNRTRFVREICQRIRNQSPNLIIASRMNAWDGAPQGWGSDAQGGIQLNEPKRLTAELQAHGLSLLGISVGNPRYAPHLNRPHNIPLRGAENPPEHPLRGIVRFQNIVRSIQGHVPNLPVVNAALAGLGSLLPPVAAGMIEERWCTLIGQGRGSIAYPNAVRDILRNGHMDRQRCCLTCSRCSQLMRDGMRSGCVLRDRDIYANEYQRGRERAQAC